MAGYDAMARGGGVEMPPGTRVIDLPDAPVSEVSSSPVAGALGRLFLRLGTRLVSRGRQARPHSEPASFTVA